MNHLGSGIHGWGTEEEEDIWDIELSIANPEGYYDPDAPDLEMTIGELLEWRYIRAEREKEQVIVVYYLFDVHQYLIQLFVILGKCGVQGWKIQRSY